MLLSNSSLPILIAFFPIVSCAFPRPSHLCSWKPGFQLFLWGSSDLVSLPGTGLACYQRSHRDHGWKASVGARDQQKAASEREHHLWPGQKWITINPCGTYHNKRDHSFPAQLDFVALPGPHHPCSPAQARGQMRWQMAVLRNSCLVHDQCSGSARGWSTLLRYHWNPFRESMSSPKSDLNSDFLSTWNKWDISLAGESLFYFNDPFLLASVFLKCPQRSLEWACFWFWDINLIALKQHNSVPSAQILSITVEMIARLTSRVSVKQYREHF